MAAKSKKIQLPGKVIAYVIPSVGISGGIGIALRHVVELQQMGYTAHIFTVNTNHTKRWHPVQDQVSIHPITDYYKQTGPDGADFLVATWWETAFTIAKLRAGEKCFLVQGLEHLFYETNDPKRSGFLMALALGYRVMTVAKWIQNWLLINFRIESTYCPNGLEEPMLKPRERRHEGRLKVLIEGASALPFKRIAESFSVLKDLDVEVWYVNSGGALRKDWKIDNYFEKLPIKSMPDIYAKCDVILKMCQIESFSLPVAEMLATGGTAVVTNGPGFREYGKHQQNMLIARDTSIAAARDELVRLINEPALLRQLQANAARSMRHFTWGNAAKILKIFFIQKKQELPQRDPEVTKALMAFYQDLQVRDFYFKIGLSDFLSRFAAFGYKLKNFLHRHSS